MNTRTTLATVVGAAAIMLTGPALGQTTDNDQKRNTDQDHKYQTPAKNKTMTDRGQKAQRIGNEFVLGSTILGADVSNGADTDFGEIKDLVVNTSNGRVVYAVLGKGGVLGVGENQYVIPYGALTWQQAEDRFGSHLTQTKLEDFPMFDEDELPRLQQPEWYSDMRTTYGDRPEFTESEQADRITDSNSSSGQYALLVLASDLDDANIIDSAGEDIGDIDEVIYEVNSGTAAFATVSIGGVLGVGDEVYIVPCSALTCTGPDTVRLDMSAESLKQAPKYEATGLEDLNRDEFAGGVYSFYGETPKTFKTDRHYKWSHSDNHTNHDPNMNRNGDMNRDDDIGRGDLDTKANPDESKIRAAFNGGSPIEFRGEVTAERTEALAPGMTSSAKVLMVKTDDGKTHKVCLGPASYVSTHNMRVSTGDEVWVKGRQANMDGTQIVIASEVRSGDKHLHLREASGEPHWMSWKVEDE